MVFFAHGVQHRQHNCHDGVAAASAMMCSVRAAVAVLTHGLQHQRCCEGAVLWLVASVTRWRRGTMACCVGTALVMLLHGLQRRNHILAGGGGFGGYFLCCASHC